MIELHPWRQLLKKHGKGFGELNILFLDLGVAYGSLGVEEFH